MKSNKKINFILCLLSAVFFIYIGARSFLLSFTHDEASSWLNYVGNYIPVWDCFVGDACWGTANNHLINTLGMQLFSGVLGDAEWVLRLPNVLGSLLYFAAVLWIVFRLSPNNWVKVAAFFLLVGNPYLLEFFSLARGYGLANAFMLGAMATMLHHLQTTKKWSLWLSQFFIFLMVMSNFTWLNFWAVSLGFWLLYAILQDKKYWFAFGATLLNGILLGLLLKNPIQVLGQKEEFLWGASSFWAGAKSVIRASLYNQKLLGVHTESILLVLILLLVLLGVGFSIFIFIKKLKTTQHQALVMASVLVSLALLAPVVQYYLLGSQFPDYRKGLMYIPLVGFLGATLLFLLKDPRVYVPFSILIVLMVSIPLWNGYNLSKTYEWGYDARTKEVVFEVERLNAGEPARLGVHWTFSHTVRYYQESEQCCDGIPWIEYSGVDYEKDDYIYVQDTLPVQYRDTFSLVKQYGWQGRLLRRIHNKNE